MHPQDVTPYFGRDWINIGAPLLTRMIYGHCDEPEAGLEQYAALTDYLRQRDGAVLYMTAGFIAQRCAYLLHEGDRTKCFHPREPLDGLPDVAAQGAVLAVNFIVAFTHSVPMLPSVCIQQVLSEPLCTPGFIGELARQLCRVHMYAHETYDRCQWARFEPGNN